MRSLRYSIAADREALLDVRVQTHYILGDEPGKTGGTIPHGIDFSIVF